MAFIFISGCILILMNSVTFAEYTFDCNEYEEPVILETHFCKITRTDDSGPDPLTVYLPDPTASDNFKSAEIITITQLTKEFNFSIKSGNSFSSLFPAVKVLTIRNFEKITFDNKNDTDKLEVAKSLFNLTALDNLTFTNANLNSEEHNWTLPEKLQHLDFSDNNYIDYDIQNLKYLKVVDFSRNNLTKIPTMAYPLHTLTELNLSDNPLNDTTTEDIAKLCTLEKLNLRRTSLTLSDKEDRYCECKKLLRWFKRLQKWIKDEHFRTFYLNMDNCNVDVEVDCKVKLGEKHSLKDAFLLRENCLTGKNGTIGEVDFLLDDDDYYDDNFQKNDTRKEGGAENNAEKI